MEKIDITTLNDNVFTTIGKEWMLVAAGNEEKFNMMTASWVGCSKFRYKSDIKSARIQLVKLLTFNTLHCEIIL